MKTGYIVLVVLVSVVFLANTVMIGLSEERAPEEKNTPSIDQLLDRMEKLEARVRLLEKRQAVVAIPYQWPTVVEGQVPFKQGEPVPKGWTRKKFNGQSYYIVPLDLHSKRIPPTAHAR